MTVEGSDVLALKVEERVEDNGRLVATWYVTDTSPYMVLAEIPTADGAPGASPASRSTLPLLSPDRHTAT